MIDFGYVIKINDNDFVVFVDLNILNSGYNVVPKDVDPYNQYDIEDVKAYCALHPEKVLTEHPLEESYLKKLELEQQLQDQEINLANTNNEIFSLVLQDYFNRVTESSQYSLTKEDVIAIFNRKADIESNIIDIKAQLKNL